MRRDKAVGGLTAEAGSEMVPSEEMPPTGPTTTWKLTLAYDGTGYNGWQVQPELPTVQGTLASALRGITGETVLPQGSGRTDAGVHALGQVASVQLEAAIPAVNLMRALNHALPPSIRVLQVEAMQEGFHARHGARRKTYEYRIFERKLRGEERVCSPFVAGYAWDCRWELDVAAMQKAAVDFMGEKDWTSFAAVDLDASERAEEGETGSMVRAVFAAQMMPEPVQGEAMLVFRVTGSGFLHHMVRNMVGTLVEIGRGAMAEDAVPGILAAKSRAAAGPTAPAQGLYLVRVEYER